MRRSHPDADEPSPASVPAGTDAASRATPGVSRRGFLKGSSAIAAAGAGLLAGGCDPSAQPAGRPAPAERGPSIRPADAVTDGAPRDALQFLNAEQAETLDAVIALPARWRAVLRATRRRLRALRGTGAVPLGLGAATALHLVLLLGWHAPVLYDLALRNDVVHGLQHAGFLAGAAVFWIWLLRPGTSRRMAYGTAVLCIAALLLVGGALGALLTFAETPRYSHYAHTEWWGLTALDDQHLAGAIMWIPAGIFYGTVAVALFVRWFATIDAGSTAGGRTYPSTARISYPATTRHSDAGSATMNAQTPTPVRAAGGRGERR